MENHETIRPVRPENEGHKRRFSKKNEKRMGGRTVIPREKTDKGLR
jgi:hypothetical protein